MADELHSKMQFRHSLITLTFDAELGVCWLVLLLALKTCCKDLPDDTLICGEAPETESLQSTYTRRQKFGKRVSKIAF